MLCLTDIWDALLMRWEIQSMDYPVTVDAAKSLITHVQTCFRGRQNVKTFLSLTNARSSHKPIR